MGQYRIAVRAGDGIGKEVMPEGVRVLDAVGRKFGISFTFDRSDFASCDYRAKHGNMMPADWKFFGAVGAPAQVPDHIVPRLLANNVRQDTYRLFRSLQSSAGRFTFHFATRITVS